MSTKTLAEAVYAAESTTKKALIADALSGLRPADQNLLLATFNPYVVYGIRKYDWPKAFASVDPLDADGKTSYDAFTKLLSNLSTRMITGNAAKFAVTATLGLYTEKTAKILARVLNRDLDCGAGRDTFQKIYPSLNIPSFELMLAGKIDEIAEETTLSKKLKKVVLTSEILLSKYGLSFPVQAEAKYDGNRLLAMVENGVIEYLARSGRPSDFCDGLFDEELLKIEKEIGPFVLDGEVLARSFQETMNAKAESGDSAKAALRFFAFDFMTLAEWKARNCSKVQHVRSTELSTLIAKLGLTKIVKSKQKICNSISELREFYAEVLADGMNDDGTLNGLGEGLIIKAMHGTYEWERSSVVKDGRGPNSKIVKSVFWVKWKPVLDLDLTMVGWEPGKGRLSKTIGKILLKGTDENGREIEARCGSGLNDKMRDYIFNNLDKCMGSVVMIECQEISLAQNATIFSARFPVFMKFRDDK